MPAGMAAPAGADTVRGRKFFEVQSSGRTFFLRQLLVTQYLGGVWPRLSPEEIQLTSRASLAPVAWCQASTSRHGGRAPRPGMGEGPLVQAWYH